MPETQEREIVEPVFGFGADADLQATMDTLVVDTSELTEGGLSDANVTIIGFDTKKGGETQKRRGSDEEFTTKDQLVIHLRVDNAEELDLENPFTQQYIALPKLGKGNDGRPRRGKATRNSSYGIWLAMLEALGVSANPDAASTYQFRGLPDLIGLKYHRLRQNFESFDGSTFPIAVATEIFGIDNEVRQQAGLEPAYLRGQAPEEGAKKK